jgi:cyclic dehypoxanthinyl futalosine synthase
MSRITVEDAAALWNNGSDDELKSLAQDVRARWHEPDRATYMVMRIINYTNVCVAQCDYCAFYVLPNQDGGYVLSREDVFAKIDELVDFGGDLVAFNGGFNPRLPLDYYCDLFASVRERYGERVEFYALTVAEFVFLADRAKLSFPETAQRLREAGVHWVTGGGARSSRRLPQTAREVEVHGSRLLRRAARDRRERPANDGDHGDRLRRDAGRAARAPAADARLPGRDERTVLVPVLDVQALRDGVRRPRDLRARVLAHIALSRIFLDNVEHSPHVGADAERGRVPRARLRRRRLRPPIEDEVTQKAGARIDLDLEGLLAIPRSLGYTRRVPARREAAGAPPGMSDANVFSRRGIRRGLVGWGRSQQAPSARRAARCTVYELGRATGFRSTFHHASEELLVVLNGRRLFGR